MEKDGKKTFGLTTQLLDEGRLRYAINNLNRDNKKIRTRQEKWVGVGWEAKSDSEKKSSSPSHRC